MDILSSLNFPLNQTNISQNHLNYIQPMFPLEPLVPYMFHIITTNIPTNYNNIIFTFFPQYYQNYQLNTVNVNTVNVIQVHDQIQVQVQVQDQINLPRRRRGPYNRTNISKKKETSTTTKNKPPKRIPMYPKKDVCKFTGCQKIRSFGPLIPGKYPRVFCKLHYPEGFVNNKSRQYKDKNKKMY